MKLGTLTVALGDLPFEEACSFLAQRGVQMVEIGCGGFPGKAHCDAEELLENEGKRQYPHFLNIFLTCGAFRKAWILPCSG